jgi:outer membrane protein assembly factor BamB
MRSRRFLLATTIGLAAVSFAAAADWPQWRGPNRDERSSEIGLLASWPKDGPKLLWTLKEAGVGYSGPAIVGDRLYTMGAIDNKEAVYAVDVATGKKLWSTEVGEQCDDGGFHGPRSTPTVDGKHLYALGGHGDLLCIDRESGSTLWHTSFKKDLKGQMAHGWGYCESVLVDGDKLLCTPGGEKGTLAALDKGTGKVLWRSTDFKDAASSASLVPVTFGGKHQVIQLTHETVAGVAVEDGHLLWSHKRQGSTAVIPTPVVSDHFVFTTSGYGVGCNLVSLSAEGDVIKADEVYKNKNMVNHHGGVVLLGDHLYGYSDGKGWVCQDFKTGTIVWAEKKLGKGSLTYADGHLYCLSEDNGTVVLAAASPDGWKESGRFQIPHEGKDVENGGRIWTHPVVANGKLYLRNQEKLFCYDVKATGHVGR